LPTSYVGELDWEVFQFLNVIPAKAGIVRLKAHLVREVEVLFRYALSGL